MSVLREVRYVLVNGFSLSEETYTLKTDEKRN